MNPKVSILIPIYKSSAFIEKCAESLFNQTFDDIEYIFVNDATPDDSMSKLQKVIDQYPKRKDRIKIIHHSINKGSAAAKNSAIDASTCEYISFVDSDDFIDPEMIELLYDKSLIENADIVVCNFVIECNDYSFIFNDRIYGNSNDNFLNMILHKETSSSMCNKLVKSHLYKRFDCRVPENMNYCEDWYIMTRIYHYATKIVKIEKPLYHYIQYNNNSITKTITRMHFENVLQFWNLLDNFLRKHNEYEKYKPIMALPKTQSKVRLMIDTHSSKLRKEYAGMFREEEKQCITHFTKGEQLMLYLIRYRLFFLAQLFHRYLVIKNSMK
jgi:glycosyltransferase involved in cell wall biosynthesis